MRFLSKPYNNNEKCINRQPVMNKKFYYNNYFTFDHILWILYTVCDSRKRNHFHMSLYHNRLSPVSPVLEIYFDRIEVIMIYRYKSFSATFMTIVIDFNKKVPCAA